MRKRYRYIAGGGITPDDKISVFRLISGNRKGMLRDLATRSPLFIRVQIPDDMKLKKSSADTYSTTNDNRTLQELNYDIVVLINGKFIVRNDLKKEIKNNVINSVRIYLNQVEKLIQTDEGYRRP